MARTTKAKTTAIKTTVTKTTTATTATIPADFAAALAREPVAAQAFEAFAPSHRREYLAWILEARRDDTRARRIAKTVTWLREGKGGR